MLICVFCIIINDVCICYYKHDCKNSIKSLAVSHEVVNFAHAFEHCSGFGAVGSAHVWGARGRWFESSNPDFNDIKGLIFNPFVFIDNVSYCEKSVHTVIILICKFNTVFHLNV